MQRGQTWPGALTNLGKSSQYVTAIAYVLDCSQMGLIKTSKQQLKNCQSLSDWVFSICDIILLGHMSHVL